MPYEIFISYRRDDAAAEAGRLFDRISWSCPPQTVFQDVEEIKPGERWPDKIQQTLLECRLVLVVIGPDFLKVADEWGLRRIDQENDWVRLEIQTALKENKHIIPVLMDGAVMPPAHALPPSIAALVQWQSFEIRRDHWNKDLSHLLAHLQTLTGVLHQVNTPVPYNPLAQLPSPEGKPPIHPFVGLRPFTAKDAHIFFGRGKEIRHLYDLLTNSYDRVFLLNGPSAAGKSSLLHGGLLPRLRYKFGHIQYKRRGNDGDTDLILQEFMHSLDGDGANSLLILDQIEEIWTQPRPVDPTAAVSGSHEGEVLAQTIRQLTDNFPECRIVLGFRKEWQAEIRDLLDVANLKYKSVFLPPLDHSAIVEAIEGVVQEEKLAHYYNLRIAPGLADRMASDLIRDDQSHIGPVLQMMLRNMWDTARAVHPDDVHLTVELYQKFNYGSLAAMLQAQLAKLPPGFKKDMESGKVLDLLRFFTTSQGTAAGRSRAELESRYTDAAQTLALTDALERLFFLQTSTENKSIVRLSHDALAPVIRSLFDKSDAPGQRAARLLEGKFPRDNNWESVNFSETDIEICRLGWRGMPVPDSRLIKALLQSKSEIARTQDNLEKRQKLALRALSISLINASKHALAEQRHSRSFRLAQLAYETFPANNSAIEAMIKSLAAHPAILEFAGHTNGIRDVNISPDGKKIATASVDGLARIWDINGKLLATLEGHTDKLRSILFSPDGNTIITASHDKTAILWDVSGALLCRLEGHTGPVIRAGFSPDGKRLITASGDATARIWDINGECLRRLEGHKEAVHVADFSPDGSLILTTSIDYTARIWDAEGQLLHQLAGHKSWVYFGTFSPDGAHILTASVDQTAILWGKDGQRLAILAGHTQTVETACFSPNGQFILTASEDHTARIWDMEGNLLHILQGHANRVIGANFSSDGNYIVTASTDQTAKIWNREGQLLRTLQGHNGALLDAKFILDDRFVLTYAADGIARIWGARGEQKNRFSGHGEVVHTVEIALDNRSILTASSDKTARLWTMDGDLLHVFEGHTKEVMTARFSPDGRHVLTASKDNTIRIWTIEGEPMRIISGPPGQFFSARYSPAGDRIITSSSDKTARVWDLEGNLLLTLEGHKESVFSAQFFADGKRMLTASIDDTIRIWDETGALQKTIATYPVYRAGLSPDESFIVVAHKDGRARFFNLEGKLIQHFIGHNFWVSSARLSPGGEVLVTASLDKTVKVWDAKSGLCYLTLEGHGGAVYDACFFPNKHRVISCSQDQTARIWDLHPDHIVAEADRRGIAFLGTDELREYEIDTIDTSREGFNRVEAILARRNEPLALAFARYYLALSKATPRNNKVHLLRARVLYMYLREKQSVWLTEKEWREVEG